MFWIVKIALNSLKKRKFALLSFESLPQFYCVVDNSEKIFIKNVGKKLREKRLSRNISQKLLAIDCDLQPSQIGRIERGEINTSIGMLFKICKVLKVDLSELLKT
nr:helix-turn-helix transcriptional regulator [Flavobacterium sp. CSZ]